MDLVICPLPRMSLFYPPLAPALLKACAEESGFKVKIVDCLIKFYQAFYKKDHWEDIDHWLVIPDMQDGKTLHVLRQELSNWAKEILSYNPRWIGLSVFSYESHKIATLLVYEIRRLNFDVKIVFGGMGVTGDANDYGKDLLDAGLINAMLQGDGEESLISLLKGEPIQGKHLLKKLDSVPFANWEDYDLDQYRIFKNQNAQLSLQSKLVDKSDMFQGYDNVWYRNDSILTLPITGSKGCVRQCTFCDVPSHWPTFYTRSAKHMFDEIVYQYNLHKPERFHFTDSLINGNMKVFREFCKLLAEWKENSKAEFSFTGQFICRNWRGETDDDYELMRKAGIRLLEVGIETGSEAVRFHMGKKFTNEDVFNLLERCGRNNIKVLFLMIVGYPYETKENHLETLQFLKDCMKYRSVIEGVVLGHTLTVDDDTTLARDPNLVFTKLDNGRTDPLLWVNKINPELTLYERLRRRVEVLELTESLGLLAPTNNQELLYLYSKWKELGRYEGTNEYKDPFKDIFK